MARLTNGITIGLISLLITASAPLAHESTCYGTAARGRLEHGVRIPFAGSNFIAYGLAPWLAGRTYVHSRVRTVVLDAYARLAKEQPSRIYQYAEAAKRWGGPIEPHKTHQNGLSVDFLVPAEHDQGAPAQLPTNFLNRYGYDIDFNDQARFKDYRIDFRALAAHLVALHRAARREGINIRRVLLDPRFQPALHATHYGDYIRERIRIPDQRSWVRHDDHYHVDFVVQCEPMSNY